jgi:hypothetical protein
VSPRLLPPVAQGAGSDRSGSCVAAPVWHRLRTPLTLTYGIVRIVAGLR